MMDEMKSSNIEAKDNLIELQVSLASVERSDAIYISNFAHYRFFNKFVSETQKMNERW